MVVRFQTTSLEARWVADKYENGECISHRYYHRRADEETRATTVPETIWVICETSCIGELGHPR